MEKKKIFYKILLVGASGSGKTYSFENLNPLTTGFINPENKPLPFKNEFKYFKNSSTTSKAGEALAEYNDNPEIECIVFDSFSAYVEMALQELRNNGITGFDLWNAYNTNIGRLLASIKLVKKHLFITAHYEILDADGDGNKEKRVKVKGKEWEGLIEKEFTIVMYCKAIKKKEKMPQHYFKIINEGDDSTKVPPAIFGKEAMEKFIIPNDAKFVIEKIEEFLK